MEESVSKSLELWTIISSYNTALLLLLIGLILHLSSDWHKNTLKLFKITISKENLSVLFIFIRDFSLFASFGISLLLINPDMFADVKFPLPFFPIGAILLGIALIFKIKGTTDINSNDRKKFFIFLILAAVVQYLGFIFVMEAAPTEWIEAGQADNFWLTLKNLRSNLNPQLSMITFYTSFPALLIILSIMLINGLKAKNNETTNQ